MNTFAERAREQGERIAAEILAAVMDGKHMPLEWYRIDAHSGCGEPYAGLVAEVVRDELSTTPVRV